MRLEINRLEGLRNDLSLRLELAEIEVARLNIAHRDRLMSLPGMPRHREATPDEAHAVSGCKIVIDEHLRHLGVLNAEGKPQCRAVAISNRNLGANHGNIAWQRGATPPIFHVTEDPCGYATYSCLTVWRDSSLSIEDLRFDFAVQRIHAAAGNRDLSDEVEWATF